MSGSGILSIFVWSSFICVSDFVPLQNTYLYMYSFSRFVNTAWPSFRIARLIRIFAMLYAAFSRLFNMKSAKFIDVLSSIFLVRYLPCRFEFLNCSATISLCFIIASSCFFDMRRFSFLR